MVLCVYVFFFLLFCTLFSLFLVLFSLLACTLVSCFLSPFPCCRLLVYFCCFVCVLVYSSFPFAHVEYLSLCYPCFVINEFEIGPFSDHDNSLSLNAPASTIKPVG